MNRKQKLYLISILEGALVAIAFIAILLARDYIEMIVPYGSTLPYIVYFVLLMVLLWMNGKLEKHLRNRYQFVPKSREDWLHLSIVIFVFAMIAIYFLHYSFT